MRGALIVVFVAFAATAAAAAAAGHEGEAVAVISGADDFALTTGDGLWVLDFYAPWCGFCKQLAPVYDTVGQRLTKQGSPVRLATINCDDPANKPTCVAQSIRGYPTLRLWVDGAMHSEYNGPRTEEGLLAAAHEMEQQFPRLPKLDATEKPAVEKPAERVVEAAAVRGNSADGALVTLTATNFDELTRTGPWMLDFYAPWCGHCKKLAPTWEKLAERMRGKVGVGAIDCTAESGLCSRFGVRGYPTLKYSIDGNVQEYKLSRSLDALSEFADRINSPKVAMLTADTLDTATKAKPVSLVFLAASDAFLKRAEELAAPVALRVPCYLAVDPSVHAQLAPSATLPVAVMLREGDVVPYPGALDDTKALQAWMDAHRMPLLVEFDAATAADLMHAPHPLVLLVVDPSDTETEAHKETVRRAMRAYGAKAANPPVNAAWLNGVQWSSYASNTFSVPHVPIVLIVDPINELYYAHTAAGDDIPLDAPGLQRTLRELHSGQLKSNYMGGVFAYGARMASKGLEAFGRIVTANLAWSIGIVVAVLALVFWWAATVQDPRPSENRNKVD